MKLEPVVTNYDIDVYGISKITKSISKSDPSRFRNPIQMIKMAVCHKLMSHTWHIVTTDDLDPEPSKFITKTRNIVST